MSSIRVKNVARRPVDIEGGRVLAHGETGDAPADARTLAQIDSGLLARVSAPRTPRGGES